MASVHGKDTTVELDDHGTPTLQDISSFVNASTFAQAFELADTTAYGLEDRTHIAGLGTANVSLGGPWDATLDDYIGSTIDMKTARSVRWRPEGDASPSYTFEAFIESYTIEDPVGAELSWSMTLRATDAVTRA